MAKQKPPPDPAAEAARERERENLVEALGGGGMPLEELGLLLVPALTADELQAKYAGVIERGKAKRKASLVNLVWATAQKNPTMQMFLAKVMLGWSEKAGVPKPGDERTGAEELGNPQDPPSQDLEGKILSFLQRKSGK